MKWVRTKHLLIGGGVTIVLLAALYFIGMRGTLVIKTDTLDPATIQVAGRTLQDVRQARVQLAAGPKRVQVSQHDYLPAVQTVWVVPFTTRTITIHSSLSLEGKKEQDARSFAAHFVEAAGTYNSDNFDGYLRGLQTLTTPALYDSLYDSDSYVKGRAYEQLLGVKAKTTAETTRITSWKPPKAQIEVASTTRSASSEGEITIHKQTLITLRRDGSNWRVSAIKEEY